MNRLWSGAEGRSVETIVIAFIAIVAVIVIASRLTEAGNPRRKRDNTADGGGGPTRDAGGDSGRDRDDSGDGDGGDGGGN